MAGEEAKRHGAIYVATEEITGIRPQHSSNGIELGIVVSLFGYLGAFHVGLPWFERKGTEEAQILHRLEQSCTLHLDLRTGIREALTVL